MRRRGVRVGARGYLRAVVEWGSVHDERGQAWIEGRLPAEEYWAQARHEAELRARRTFLARLARRRQESAPRPGPPATAA